MQKTWKFAEKLEKFEIGVNLKFFSQNQKTDLNQLRSYVFCRKNCWN